MGTPQGDTGAADLSHVEAVVSQIARSINGYKVIVEKSTVPVYTNEWIRRVLHRHGVAPESFDVVSNPEFLREGTAIMDFLHPDRIVVGANTERAAEVMRRIYEPLTGGSYYAQPDALPGACSASAPAKLLVTSAQSAEIIKHASNAFLAMKISFINAVANLAETVDADIEDISAGMGMDSRIGSQVSARRPGLWRLLLSQGRGRLSLGGAAAGRGLPTARRGPQGQRYTRRISSSTRCAPRCGPCAASGWPPWAWPSRAIPTTFASLRPSTSSRNSSKPAPPSRPIDPAAMERAKEVLPPSREAAAMRRTSTKRHKDADAVLILTDWKEFAEIDLARLNQAVRFPIVIDGRNLYKPQQMLDHGFTYVSVGRPARYQAQQGKPRKLAV